MSRKLNKQLKELEQRAQNDLFVKDQRLKSKPADVRRTENHNYQDLMKNFS